MARPHGHACRDGDHGPHPSPRRHHAKKKTLRADGRYRTDVVERRKAFAKEVATWAFEKIIFIDECGVNLAMTPRCARSLRGCRAVSRVPFSRGNNISVLASMRARGVEAWETFNGAVNGERFLLFAREKLAPTIQRGDVVVLDNVSFHHNAEVRAVIEARGGRLVFIPPYHPELNAAEELFSLLKSALRRRKARIFDDLISAIGQILAATDFSRRRGFIRHALELAAQ